VVGEKHTPQLARFSSQDQAPPSSKFFSTRVMSLLPQSLRRQALQAFFGWTLSSWLRYKLSSVGQDEGEKFCGRDR
jgi:hypothetical protein